MTETTDTELPSRLQEKEFCLLSAYSMTWSCGKRSCYIKDSVKMRFGFCQCLLGHFDKASFSEGKGKVCCPFKGTRISRATGITTTQTSEIKVWREVHRNRFGSKDERWKVKEESAWGVL